jgi:hypothetical protein
MHIPSGMPMDALLVVVLSAATVMSLVRGARGITHFGWNSRRGLWHGYGILVGVYIAYITSHLIDRGSASIVAVVIGLVGGGLLVSLVRPQRPTNLSGRSGAGLSVLILACILGIVWVIAPRPDQLLEGGVALLAFSSVVLFITRVHPEDSGVKE